MGWTYMKKPLGKSAKDVVQALFAWEDSKWKVEPMSAAIVKLRTAYLAVRRANKETGVSYVFAAVVLLDLRVSERHDLGFKDMDESVGPCEAECPEKILRLLTPLDDPSYPEANDWAREWRERCWDNIRRRKTMSGWKSGTRIRFPGGLAFKNGTRHEEFVIEDPKKRILRVPGDAFSRYKIPRKIMAQAEVIS